MSTDTPEAKRFMLELYTMTEGDMEMQVSMYEVGAALGLDKGAVSSMSEELIIEELVELKTLSGGIGITRNGLELLQQEGIISGLSDQAVQLGQGPILDQQDLQQLEQLLMEIKKSTLASQGSYSRLEELVIDLKTLETQLLSPRPKTAIVREVLGSIQGTLVTTGVTEIATKLKGFLRL